MTFRPRTYTFDAELALHMASAGGALDAVDTGSAPIAIAADAFGTVNGIAKVVDAGSDTATFTGVMVVDVGTVTGVNTLLLQGSTDAAFAAGTVINLGVLPLNVGGGHLGAADVDAIADRYEVPVVNEQGDVVYRYFRVQKVGAGTLEINAFMGRASGPVMG